MFSKTKKGVFMGRCVLLIFIIFFSILFAQPDSLHTNFVTRVRLINSGQAICAFGDYLYVAVGVSGIEYFNIMNPWHPDSVCVYGTTQRFNDCAVGVVDTFGVELCVPNMSVDFIMLDANPCPSSPDFRYDHPSASYATGIDVLHPFVVVAELSDGVFLMNFSAGTSHVISTPGIAYCVAFDNTYHIYVGCGNGLYVYDAYTESLLGSYTACGRVNCVRVIGGVAYVGTGNILRMLDVSNPASIREIGRYTFDLSASVQNVFIDETLYDSFVFCATGNGGLQILDVFKPDSIKVVGRYYNGNYCKDVCVVGQFIYTIMGQDLVILKHFIIPHFDGWSFLNEPRDIWYTDGRTWPMWRDFRDAFGQSICETPGGSHRPLASRYYHSIARINAYNWEGSCYGMANTMMGFHDNFWHITDLRWNPTGEDHAFEIPINDTLKHLINTIFLYQFGTPAWEHWAHWRNRPSGIVRRWHRDYLDSLFVLGIDPPGHEVTPFRLAQQDDHNFTLELYDPNNGISIETLLLDTLHETWKYAHHDWTNYLGLELCPVNYVYTRPRFSYEWIQSNLGGFSTWIYTSLSGRAVVYNAAGDSAGSNSTTTFISDSSSLGWVTYRGAGDPANPNSFWIRNATNGRIRYYALVNDSLAVGFVSPNNSFLDFDNITASVGDTFYFQIYNHHKVGITTNTPSRRTFNVVGVVTDEGSPLSNRAVYLNRLSIAQGETIVITIDDTSHTALKMERRLSGRKEGGFRYTVYFEQCDSLSTFVSRVFSTDSISTSTSETHSFNVNDWNNLNTTNIYLQKDIGNDGTTDSTILLHTSVGIPEQSKSKPIAFYGNFPNPFNVSTTIVYNVPDNEHIKLEIVNIVGNLVSTLVDGYEEMGIHFVKWDAGNLPAGIYFAKLTTSRGIELHRMMLIK